MLVVLTHFLLRVDWTASPLNDIPIITVLNEIFHFYQASYAKYWFCKPISFWGPIGLSRCPVLRELRAPNMGYRGLTSPLNRILISTVLYEIFHFPQDIALPDTSSVNQIPFENRMVDFRPTNFYITMNHNQVFLRNWGEIKRCKIIHMNNHQRKYQSLYSI